MDCLNTQQAFFMYFGIFSSTLLLSSIFISKYIWAPMQTTFQMPPLPYKNRYPLDDDEETSDDLGELMHNVLVEQTPNNTVFMRYNKDIEGFEYWCQESLKYIILDTVARKYVLLFRCANVYVEQEKKEIKKQEEEEEDHDNELFLKSKTNKKNTVFFVSNKFIYKGAWKDAPFFKKEQVKKTFFCGSNVQGLDFTSFKNALAKKKIT